MTPAGLGSMPIELLVHIIATYLSTKDLGSLRLTSKYAERTLFDTFAKEFFTKKQFMLTTPSLTALIDISKHAALSKFVKHIIIGLEQFESQYLYCTFGNPASHESYRAGWADQDYLTKHGLDVQLLAQAFRNFPNLETLGIRDYNAQSRYRDSHTRWQSYGAPTVYENTGIRLTCKPPDASLDFSTNAFQSLLLAVADANITIESIEVILRNQVAGLSDFAFTLPSLYAKKLQPVLEGLRTLLLTVNMFPQHLRGFSALHRDPPGQVHTPPSHPQLFLPDFLSRTKNLKHLRLNFQSREHQAPTEFLRQLVRSADAAFLPNLEHVEFGMMTTTPDLLLQVITKLAPNLRALGFWKVSLTYTRSAQQSDSNRPNPWRNFLSHISKVENLNLTSMMLGCITITDGVEPPVAVKFCDKSEEASLADGGPDRLEKIRECKGDMKTFLPQLISHLRVRWPKSPIVINDDEEDEDMEDEEAEEEEEGDEDDDTKNEDEDYEEEDEDYEE
jgi:hypothetical protein